MDTSTHKLELLMAKKDNRDTSYIHEYFDDDMPTIVIVYRLSVYFSLCLTVSTLYLPEMKVQSNVRRSRINPVTLTTDQNPLFRPHRSAGQERSQWNKRSVYNVFSKMMTRHANRHNNDKVFVDRMFNLFDLNRDRVIEKREFKVMLQNLEIVSHLF